ncbi:MAG: phytoene desaturase [Chitinophagales bacterium]|nr:phytoene desaturase [Chitinophagales bacterium]
MKKKKVLIIGTGLGGLATALRLSSRGFEVEMVEKYHQPGGRLNRMSKDGFDFDMGPSFFSMSYEFRELFDDVKLPIPFTIKPLDPLYAVYFAGKKDPFLIYKNKDELAKTFAGVEPDFKNKLVKYLEQAKEIFHDTEYRIVKKNFESPLQYALSLTSVPLKHAGGMFTNMWQRLSKNFDSEEVKIIFSLVAFFLGATPYQTPAVYSLMNYMELEHDGYWNVEGGMYKITESIVNLLTDRGVKFHFNTEIISRLEVNGELNGFVDDKGKEWKADIYVVNADAAAFRGGIFKRKKFAEKKLDKMSWTLAPFTIYLGVKGKIPELHQHNYFLGSNFKEYADKIFKTSVAPEKPYYYVNVSSRSNPACAPEGCENIFILCPVPDLRFKSNWDDAEQLTKTIISDLSTRINYNLHDQTISQTVLTPLDWEEKFNLYKGSGLGLAHGMMQVGGFRPANKDEVFKNVFYTGASTIPGTGLPMVIISSKLVTERIENYVRTV